MRTSLVLVAGSTLLLVASHAFAQGDAAPAPAPAPADQAGAPAPAPAPAPGATPAPAFGASVAADTGAKPEEKKEEKKPEKLPWHGSILLFDQSVTTQTVGVGGDYQSANPAYEHWYSFRPRWWFYEDDENTIDVGLRMDVYHELTNSDSTTQEREPVFGDVWVTPSYGRVLYKDKEAGVATKLTLGPRFTVGTSKSSRGRGQAGTVGAGASLSQQLPIAGKGAPVFASGGLNAGLSYSHPLVRCTTPCSDSFERVRQDTEGRSFVSDTLSGGPMVNHSVIASVGGAADVTEKLHLGLTYIWIMQWTYGITDSQAGAQVNTTNGPASAGAATGENFRVLPWFLASLDYDLIDEVGLGVGYYNYTNQLNENGQRRNPLWSPDARFFFTVTANLDAIYETASGRNEKKSAAAPAFTTF